MSRMTPFLKIVAKEIYNKFSNELHDIAMVFPNKRAGLFFNEYLLQCSGKPVWSPRYITISELFQSCSNAVVGDSILLVSKLYDEYKYHTHSNESIDNFYYWGELLIKDFDDIDKNIADKEKIFSNLADLRRIGDTTTVLDKEQVQAIEQFFSNFRPNEESELKKRFLQIWEVIGNIYDSFKNTLRKENIAYEGMLYRDVIEQNSEPYFPHKKYIFVGFNALNKVEEKLFEKIKEQGKALFYWDYDISYLNDSNHEAGRFMRQNLKKFPNALQDEIFDNIRNKRVNFISTSTDSIQLRYASRWIDSHIGEREVDTAVILCDESKLESVYHIIPPRVKERNITMGFPLSHTPAYDLVKQLINLQTTGHDSEHNTFTQAAVHELLNNPYIVKNSEQASAIDKEIIEKRIFFPPLAKLQADELLATIFTRRSDNAQWFASIGDIIQRIAKNEELPSVPEEKKNSIDIYRELYLEALLKVFTQTQRFIDLLGNGNLALQQKTLGSLLLRVLASTKLPFHGEPVIGMQIMGLLETRNLDFKNIIFLSANEGNLPRKSSESSFIPYNLRRAFGLTLSEHRDSIYAYNFYRLLQRAENITLVYNNSSNSNGSSECSRYILQLMAAGLCAQKVTLTSKLKNSRFTQEAVEKNDEIINTLRRRYDYSRSEKATMLSPSAINSYLKCPLSFFFRYVMNLKAQEEYAAEVKNNDFGNIFHKAAELFYGKNERTVERGDLLPYLEQDYRLYEFIDAAFKEEFFKNTEQPTYNGEQYINREVLHRFLKRLVRMDCEHTPFRYLGCEKDIFFYLDIPFEKGFIKLCIGGRVDRIDYKNDTLEIIDYKTGGKEEVPKETAQIFDFDTKNMSHIFQVLLYSVAAIENNMANKVSPSLIYIHKKSSAQRGDYVIKIAGKPILDVAPLCKDFKAMLQNKISGIFDPQTPFTPTSNEAHCQWCDFRKICGKPRR